MLSIYNSNYKDFVNIHTDTVVNYCFNKSKFYRQKQIEPLIKLYFGSIVSSFDELIKASPEILEELKDFFETKTFIEKNIIKRSLNFKALYGYFINNTKNYYYNSKIKGNYNAYYLSDRLNVFTCPYCNENYTYSFKYKNGNRRTFDFDHFYSKDEYPFLAISFFNLLPSCKVCNQIKSNNDDNIINPHKYFDADKVYFFDLKPVDASFISDSSKIEIDLIAENVKEKEQVVNSILSVGVDERYKQHKELIQDILNKKRIYTDSYLNSLKEQVPYLKRVGISEIKKAIFGVSFNNEEYYKRPFSKLTNDIIKNRHL